MRLAFLLALAGCTPTFTNLTDACDPGFSGDSHASFGAQTVLDRVNCYRRLTKLGKTGVVKEVQEEAVQHAAYMQANQDVTPTETTGKAGFVGADVATRLQLDGVDMNGLQVWDVNTALDPKQDLSAFVDKVVDDFYERQLVLQPSVWASGFARSPQGFVAWPILFEMPPSQGENAPTTYPVDGQVDVPLSFVAPNWPTGTGSPYPDDGIPDGDSVGYPITFIPGVGGESSDPNNPFGVTFTSANIEGPSGSVDFYELDPASKNADVALLQTIAIVPKAPLDADTTYKVEAKFSTVTDDYDVTISFKTGAGS